jgi:MbtH protein
VRNHEEQYSVWRSDKALPAGWESVGEPAPKDVCLKRVDELWTDMRPLSLRESMAVSGQPGR